MSFVEEVKGVAVRYLEAGKALARDILPDVDPTDVLVAKLQLDAAAAVMRAAATKSRDEAIKALDAAADIAGDVYESAKGKVKEIARDVVRGARLTAQDVRDSISKVIDAAKKEKDDLIKGYFTSVTWGVVILGVAGYAYVKLTTPSVPTTAPK